MAEGLKATFHVLSGTPNEAAVSVLVPGLDAPDRAIQTSAVRALLKRRSPAGRREIIRRLHRAPDGWREILSEYSGRMSAALRDAVLSTDPQVCENGMQAILWFGEYDLMPTLVNAAEDRTNPNADRAAQTLVELADLLYQELAAPRDYSRRRDPQLVRRHLTSSLELSVKRFSKHRRRETIEAYLLLADRDQAALKRVLQNPHDQAYRPVIEMLTHSPRPGVIRLLLAYLEDANAPHSALNVLAHRRDLQFLKHLLSKIGFEPSSRALRNLKRIDSIVWLRGNVSLLDQLDDAAQHAAVTMAQASGMKRDDVFGVLVYLLSHGKPGGRRAAAEALAEHRGNAANRLAEAALKDADPGVQAAIYRQLRQRGIPGAINRLIDQVDHPHPDVRAAVRESLEEFSFERFATQFETLDEEVRCSTGVLVKKVDRAAVAQLQEEMVTRSRSRRLRAIEMAIAMQACPELEETLIDLLDDGDHILRSAACRALKHCRSGAARTALIAALEDRSASVQQAAQESVEQML